ncbi:MAG: tRNA (N6-threonylcarbamoyladenosine(37)-N6)-methyltransferase TrmO [Deferrisomatales bacterium]
MNPSRHDRYEVVPVGFVRSPISTPDRAPRQGRDAGLEVVLEILPAYEPALQGIERWPQLVVLCWMHRGVRDRLQVVPRGDPALPLAGVFATRSPHRPNPLAVYTVDLLEVRGRCLRVRGVDAVDGTPVVDLRPHVPRLDR